MQQEQNVIIVIFIAFTFLLPWVSFQNRCVRLTFQSEKRFRPFLKCWHLFTKLHGVIPEDGNLNSHCNVNLISHIIVIIVVVVMVVLLILAIFINNLCV
jgi:hypothetical protein